MGQAGRKESAVRLADEVGLAANAGACLGSSDKQIWDSGGREKFGDLMSSYGKECLGFGGCVGDHFKDDAGYTKDCAGCFGDMAGCSASNCAFQCTLGGDSSCQA